MDSSKYVHDMISYLRLMRWHMPLAGAALVTVLTVRAMLLLMPYRLVLRITIPDGSREPLTEVSDSRRRRQCAVAVGTAARLVPKASCLTQALATIVLLRLQGDRAKLVYGVRHDASGRLQAHAWLETSEGVLIGHTKDLSTFQPMGGLELQA